VVGATYVNQELALDYSVSVAAQTISPDPVTASPKDDAFINLTCLKAACLVERSAARKAASKGYLVRDGGTTVDSREKARLALEALAKNYCKAYEDGKRDYFINRPVCAAIMGPIRLYARDYYRPGVIGREEN
jgi:hypothetical protein